MADAPLNRQEIRSLAKKLEQLDDVLSKKEIALILRIFDVASAAVTVASAAVTEATGRSQRGTRLTEMNEDSPGAEVQLSDNSQLSEGFLFYFGDPGRLPDGDPSRPILEPPPPPQNPLQ